jgi:hypothetical protein
MEKIGTWAFLIGVLIAIIAGLVPSIAEPITIAWVLAILGLVVGLLNIRGGESQEFLTACIAIVIMVIGLQTPLGRTIGTILVNIVAFVAPAALLVALRAVWKLAED